ncbi:MAG: SAM-dependent methyltransferase [Microbacteriaceae bacterium]|jgi:16S rRNA (guanine1207-N2)-methyltransferase|nr:SAM-dependent methyltransferase [Microbacteriaceae bacterium]
MSSLDFAGLRRFPDVEADNLFPVDASDRLILDEALAAVGAAPPGVVVVLGDHYGALTIGAAQLGARGIRVFQDSLLGERSLANNAADGADFRSLPLGGELLDGATVVLLQLPRSLAELDELAGQIAEHSDPAVVVYAGGRMKHISVAMNEVLLRHFERLDVSHARQKSRVLVARTPRRVPTDYPSREFNEELGLWICAHGAAFAGTKLDIGTRLLLSVLDGAVPGAETVIDLGCGTGILAASLARARPSAAVIATDVSWAAVASARATMEANALGATVVRDVGLSVQPESSADLVVLNPPFHVGATVHTGLATGLFAESARVLRPGAELWTVYNSHLGYRAALQRIVGDTREVVRNAKFTVTASRRA